MTLPALVPAMAVTGTSSNSRVSRTAIWAMPRAAPPERANPIPRTEVSGMIIPWLGRRGDGGALFARKSLCRVLDVRSHVFEGVQNAQVDRGRLGRTFAGHEPLLVARCKFVGHALDSVAFRECAVHRCFCAGNRRFAGFFEHFFCLRE